MKNAEHNHTGSQVAPPCTHFDPFSHNTTLSNRIAVAHVIKHAKPATARRTDSAQPNATHQTPHPTRLVPNTINNAQDTALRTRPTTHATRTPSVHRTVHALRSHTDTRAYISLDAEWLLARKLHIGPATTHTPPIYTWRPLTRSLQTRIHHRILQ